jgi:predicted DNA-binding transcriptional regulator AlpA
MHTPGTRVKKPNLIAEQLEFDAKYISAKEVGEYLDVRRSQVYCARVDGRLPNAIDTGHSFIWVREQVEGILEIWLDELTKRRACK